ncbi:DEAD/DEAH box helicase [Modestobacter sp. VKM Ac-2978]|uniref:DEAD/DEAH box helicase n=1 Tax=Modestobacter sp. VKM Ac-2978 TaxID=3004132 RepID=UPI0022AB3E29|nr:DEAD/DEAH box helicase family protein [Modestobacter sp. VKM Ac-2978]MCZ2849137.1 DEAD/DEAH box helicase family protein [Modestobacter sp. VKM Ac-2978]
MTDPTRWMQPDASLTKWLATHRENALQSYRANPLLVSEHGRQEDSFRTGGYANRQVLELIQNAADAQQRSGRRGRIELRLTSDALYCANDGEPFTQRGLEAVCQAYMSDKRADEIGRFGLGFKSVLAVTDRPAVFSTSVSFGFDAGMAARALRSIQPHASLYPVLRLPTPLDVQAECAADEVLAELAEWAVTVIRLPLASIPDRLFTDLYKFPHEFLLFAPSVERLRIEVTGQHGSASIEHACVSHDDNRMTLVSEDGQEADWLVWHRQHHPSEAALAEVGEALRRDEVRVSYAVPLDDASSLGRFWAYFPLQDVTSARGIHNAPWRINDDRTNLLDGRFNEELLEVLADMIVAGLPSLTDSDDPARHFDYLPARGREAPNGADKYLAEVVPPKARVTACIPDATGALQRPNRLFYPAADLRLDLQTFGLWDAAPERPADAPHWTCYKTPTRRARLRSLVRVDDSKMSDREIGPAEWVERIAGDGRDDKVDAALKVVFSVSDEFVRRDMLTARILPDTTGALHRLNATSTLYLRGNLLSSAAGLALLRPPLLALGKVAERLEALGFKDVEPQEELRKLATAAARKWSATEWTAFWGLVEEVTVAEAENILVDHVAAGAPLKVRSAGGRWQDVGAVVVPGLVEPIDSSLALDVEFHEFHLSLLKSLGVAVRPVVSRANSQDMTLLEYLRIQRAAALEGLPPRGRPEASALHFQELAALGPLHVLRRFGDTGDVAAQAVWTTELLEAQAPSRWHLGHINPRVFEPRSVLAPHLWAAERYGLLESSWGPRSSAKCLSHELTQYASLLPVATRSSSSQVRTVSSLSEVPLDLWREFLGRTSQSDDAWLLGDLLVEACRRLPTEESPIALPHVGGDPGHVPTRKLLLARTEDEQRALTARGLPHVGIRSDEAETLLTERWGCTVASTVLRVEIATETPGEPIILLDRFRGLRALAGGQLDDVELIECSDLARQVTGPDGLHSEAADFARSGKTVFYVGTVHDDELLGRLSDEFGLDLTSTVIQRVLDDAQDEQVNGQMAACRAADTPSRKLLALLPGPVLESLLPSGLLATVRRIGEDTGPEQVAELLLHVHGYNVLSELRHVLESAGYPVPDRWAGSSPAVAFVRRLGFPSEYAGIRGASLDPDLTVFGPPRLDPLHEYQAKLADQIRDLVSATAAPGRAMLFLPTGAGKTRVTVEAFTKAFIEDGFQGPLLWIAQTEELCEQAVQTWSLVWREFGDRPLRVCRLWSTNEVARSDEALTVVVATDAKLDKLDRDEYDWLQKAAAVVIDEAHTATGTGISETLGWLGIGQGKTARPLLGLTATPFKGTGTEANKRLAVRFGSRQLDVLGDDPYGELQRLGVLARIEHEVLDGVSITLKSGEAKQVETFGAIPQAVLERVGQDEERTRRLLDHIAGLPDDWPVLVFTASVLSSQTLAALLRVRGIEAASVSGTTRMYDRRRSIDAFRKGDIKVLTNCNVLTQGFDAPAVRALYIARPTFSPNAYIQMVGRGLRGPANGGKEECRIVNVADTFDQFGDKLAYKEFDYLWRKQGGRLG